jgi:hypothetical protein
MSAEGYKHTLSILRLDAPTSEGAPAQGWGLPVRQWLERGKPNQPLPAPADVRFASESGHTESNLNFVVLASKTTAVPVAKLHRPVIFIPIKERCLVFGAY